MALLFVEGLPDVLVLLEEPVVVLLLDSQSVREVDALGGGIGRAVHGGIGRAFKSRGVTLLFVMLIQLSVSILARGC